LIPELGHFALTLCLPMACVLAVLPLWGAMRNRSVLMSVAVPLAHAQFVLLLFAFSCLAYAFLNDDFSVTLVANHANTALPQYYKFSALWGNHEGSLLLWVLILAGWSSAVALFSKSLPMPIKSSVLSVLAMISVGFLLFVLLTSNPFERNLLNPPLEGNDLNPLLQDIGLILHPPMLYLGYVGFSVAFAFAIVALITGQFDAAWARWSRPWTNIAWSFLTVGIGLGSWWAYYELGWGGWWFWDPVENASFMPWLAGTALLHSLSATEKRGVFRSWTILLAILAFSLSLLGTFLVRSGILVSVHAFAADPTRGLFILAFLVVVIGGSLLLYALRAPNIRSASTFDYFSRETWLLLNNIVLAVALAVVLLGTLFPLIMSSLDLGSYSVGPPYFNRLFLPLMVPMLILMAWAPYLNWKRAKITPLVVKRWYWSALLILLIAVVATLLLGRQYGVAWSWFAALTLFISLYLIAMTLGHVSQQAQKSGGSIVGLRKLTRSYWGMVAGHLGIAVTALGIGLSGSYAQQKEVRMRVGDTLTMAGLRYELAAFKKHQGPNYVATQALVKVYRQGEAEQPILTLTPEKRVYTASQSVMTEAGIDAGLTRDLYVSLGDSLGGNGGGSDGEGSGSIDNSAWAVRIYVKPYIRLIWLGVLIMAAGGAIAVTDKRYRNRAKITGSPSTDTALDKPIISGLK
jgi:cytochrome c-type biogenesis protein CcmF